MASQAQEDSSTFRWTTPKGLSIIGLFLALALISEYFIVSFFSGSGLTEASAYPLPVSPLFHLLPLAMILVLVSSWIYLTKNVAIRPHRISPAKVPKAHRRHPRRRKTRVTFTQSVMASVKKFFSKIAAVFSRSRNVSSPQRRLSFARTALESTVTILTIFLLSIILLSVLVYPRLFTDFAVRFYSTTSPLQDFMESLANALIPIASGLNSIAPSFSNAFRGLVASSSQPLTQGDLLLRYVFCQNAAAWISAISALAYVRYTTKTYRRNK
jgi:hypothetical protein